MTLWFYRVVFHENKLQEPLLGECDEYVWFNDFFFIFSGWTLIGATRFFTKRVAKLCQHFINTLPTTSFCPESSAGTTWTSTTCEFRLRVTQITTTSGETCFNNLIRWRFKWLGNVIYTPRCLTCGFVDSDTNHLVEFSLSNQLRFHRLFFPNYKLD